VRGASLALAETRTQANRVAITSSSTLAQVQTEYLDTLDYAASADAALAARFVKAARYLLVMMPKRASRESESAEWDLDGIRAALNEANGWLVVNGTASPNAAPTVKYLVPGFSRYPGSCR
jgi:hypothetical protein